MQLSRPPIQPIAPAILDALPNPPLPEAVCPRRTRQQLDLMLLAIEALDLGGAEAMLTAAQELDLQSVIKNRVSFWRLRATNPLRRYSQRRPLTLNEAKALVFMTCHLARRMTVFNSADALGIRPTFRKAASFGSTHSPRQLLRAVSRPFSLSHESETHCCNRLQLRRKAQSTGNEFTWSTFILYGCGWRTAFLEQFV